jgi:DNA-binding GntR family transcriptional regulator
MNPMRKELERNSAKPLYAQLKGIIQEQLENGEWQANQMIPSENELASS